MTRKDFLNERNKKIKQKWQNLIKKGYLSKQIISILRNEFKLSRRQIYNIVFQ